ncbi:hypothetical protein JCM17960_13290 [Magnetospira thiophila]
MRAYEAEDYATARATWQPLAEAGDPQAQYWLGYLYRFGHGLDQDFETAIVWYKKAAQQTADGDIMRRAAYALGYMVKRGHGTPKDLEKAECLYRVAAENGYANAQAALHLFLREKPGIDFEALDWAERAARQGQDQGLFATGYAEVLSPFGDTIEGLTRIIIAERLKNKHAIQKMQEYRDADNQYFLNKIIKAEEKSITWQAEIEPLPAMLVEVPDGCWP